MALDPQQQFQLDLETTRHNNVMAMQLRQIKLDSIRLAKETLIENARSKPVESRDISASDIVAFATTLETHINN